MNNYQAVRERDNKLNDIRLKIEETNLDIRQIKLFLDLLLKKKDRIVLREIDGALVERKGSLVAPAIQNFITVKTTELEQLQIQLQRLSQMP